MTIYEKFLTYGILETYLLPVGTYYFTIFYDPTEAVEMQKWR